MEASVTLCCLRDFLYPEAGFWLLHITAVSETSWARLGTKSWVFTSKVNVQIACFVQHLNKTN